MRTIFGRTFSNERAGTATTLALFSLVAVLPLTACDEATGSNPDTGTFYGDPIALGQGTARSYLVLDDGATVELGVALSENALTDLPADHSPGGIPMPDGHHMFDFALSMPSRNPTPFRFVGLGWNPAGHEPPGIYDLPHFDFHFYTISRAERDAIVPTDPQWAAKAGSFPAAQFVPEGYLAASTLAGVDPALASVPQMGMHWMDPESPELHGETFTKTFIYGSWDGRITFAEPMVTRAFLQTKPAFRTPVARADAYAVQGADPSEYRVYWNAGTSEYRVALTGFGPAD